MTIELAALFAEAPVEKDVLTCDLPQLATVKIGGCNYMTKIDKRKTYRCGSVYVRCVNPHTGALKWVHHSCITKVV